METRNKVGSLVFSTCLMLSACASETDTNKSETDAKDAERSESEGRADTSENAAGEGAREEEVEGEAAEGGQEQREENAAAAPEQSHTVSAEAARDPKTPLKDLPAECRGFDVLGLTQSPGGETLPNTCAPFHGTHNNPYAVRCIDADPTYKTPYEGDEFCILPPPEELGTQIHVGPEDFENPGTFGLAPGQEENTYYYVNSHNAEAHYYYRTNWRMREGSHHMIITVADGDREDGWASDLEGDAARNIGGLGFDPNGRSFGGSQRPDLDRPQGVLDVPPENVGIGALLDANQQFSFNLHHINISEEPMLREAWVNVWYMDEKDVTKQMKPLAASGSPRDVAIPAHKRTILEYECNVEGDSRIITMNGHRHAHTDRFAIWVTKGESNEQITAYESFNWEDMPTYQYDSVSTNPKPDVGTKTDGASSGMLEVTAGDKLHFLCDINNTLDVPLKFANEAIDGEMCIVFGTYIGDTAPCSGGAKRVNIQE
ncbi:MAG: hypothetical protein ABW321_24880 [Polyangiales bacterium]